MKTTTLAVAAYAVSGALLLNTNNALAKGPLGVEGQSPLVLIKESVTEIDLKDFPFGLEEGTSKNVRMSFDQEIAIPEEDESVKLSYVVMMPSLDVEKDGDDIVSIKFPKEYKLTMTTNVEGDDFQMDMAGLTDNQVMTFERDGDRMKYSGSADGFSATVTSPQAAENGIDFVFEMSGRGFVMAGEGAAEQDYTDIQTLDISYDYTMDSMSFAATGEGDEPGQQFEMSGKSGTLAASGQIGKGRVEGESEINGFDFSVSQPLPIKASVGKLSTGFGMPTDPSPKPQDIKYLIGAEDIVLDDFLWGLMDPNEAFPRDLKRLVIDLEMKAMMMVSLFDPEAMAEIESSGVPPLIPTTATIKSIAFDGLGLKVDATGEGALKGTQPEGEAYVSVKGLSDFVASAVKAGMFGDQESLMIEGMAGQLGKEGDDGALIFDIKTDAGMVNINGAPIMPIPGAQ